MNRESVQAWLDNYVEAWRTYDASKIGNLFSDDALYFYTPFDGHDPVRGREAIVANWLEQRNDPDTWQAHYVPVAVEDCIGVAQGRTRYLRTDSTVEREFANIIQGDDVPRQIVFAPRRHNLLRRTAKQ